MSNKINGLKMVAAPALIALMGAPLAAGCSDSGLPGTECAIEARIDALTGSVDALVEASTEMKGKLVVACAGIAGMDDPPENPTDEDVTTICGAASAEIDAQLSGGGSISIAVSPGGCKVDASAQFSCEGSCQAEANCECEEPSLSARCTPGELSGECTGQCSGSCRAEAGATVECSGTCQGTCEGMCDGTCSVENTDGSCAGECTGTCEGTCSGSCEIGASAMAECSGTCKGECDVEFMAPQCEAELQPPSCECEAAAECQASCDGQASLKAECTPPTVEIVAEGSVDAMFVTRMEANFPAVLEVVGQVELVAAAMGDVVTQAGGIVGELDAQCAAAFAGELTASAEAAVSAQASVNVSVMASAEVNGSAMGGT